MPRISIRFVRRIVGNPATFLLGPKQGLSIDDATYEEMQEYWKLLDRKTRECIPQALFYVHFNMLCSRDEILGSDMVGEEPRPWAVGNLEESDYEGSDGWGVG